MSHSSMPSPSAASLLDDEPYWVMCTREYVLPSIMFAGMMYFLLFHVLIPMWEVGFPTREPAPGFVAESYGGSQQETSSTDAASMENTKED